MLDALISKFLNSSAGAEVIGQLKSEGVEEPKAREAVAATAEGTLQQVGSGGGAGGLGGALGGVGGLGALAAGMLGGQAAGAVHGPASGALAAPVARYVSERTGLSLSLANSVVSLAMPKLLSMIQSKDGAAKQGGEGGGLGGMVGGLFK